MRVRVYDADRRPADSDPPESVLYQFHLAEKRREKRKNRWRTARIVAAWIWCGLVISYICHVAIRMSK